MNYIIEEWVWICWSSIARIPTVAALRCQALNCPYCRLWDRAAGRTRRLFCGPTTTWQGHTTSLLQQHSHPVLQLGRHQPLCPGIHRQTCPTQQHHSHLRQPGARQHQRLPLYGTRGRRPDLVQQRDDDLSRPCHGGRCQVLCAGELWSRWPRVEADQCDGCPGGGQHPCT